MTEVVSQDKPNTPEKVTIGKHEFIKEIIQTEKGTALLIKLTENNPRRFLCKIFQGKKKIAAIISSSALLHSGRIEIEMDGEKLVLEYNNKESDTRKPKDNPFMFYQSGPGKKLQQVQIGFKKNGLLIEPREEGVLSQSSGVNIFGTLGMEVKIKAPDNSLLVETISASSVTPSQGLTLVTDNKDGSFLGIQY